MKSYQNNNPFPRGSAWRKWDLHVHAPGGRLADGYGDSDSVWRKFCRILADSDVDVFGITDYFSLDSFFECRRRFKELHPDIRKVFFPNIELRLPESVNKDAETVELHILMRPDLEKKRGETLLAHLITECKEEERDRQLPCSELATKAQFESATVTRKHVVEALEKTFGEQGEDPEDYMLIVPANHGGLRSDLGEKRKSEIADRIDELVDGVFGSEDNVEHFLNADRAKGNVKLPPRPVFAGSDAHNINDLKAWLGREVRDGPHKSVTWIKADPNFEGLLQTKAEPRARVRLQATKPDTKDPYRYLKSVTFTGTNDFPKEAVFLNSNLVAVIGPRSSGKSSLLAYIAHAIDPEYTERMQSGLEPHRKPDKLGPAPGRSWTEVEDIDVEVEWAEPNTTEGRIIYVPQNALYAISQRPGEITEKIEPALRQSDREFDTAMRQMSGVVDAANEEITLGVSDWFRISNSIEQTDGELRDRGDKDAVEATRKELSEKITAKREASALSDEEAELYEKVMEELSETEARLAVIEAETHELSAYLVRKGGKLRAEPKPNVEVRITPSPTELPEALRQAIGMIANKVESSTVEEVAAALVSYQVHLDKEAAGLRREEKAKRGKHRSLIKRNEANSEIEALTTSRRRQDELLSQIKGDEKRLGGLRRERAEVVERLASVIDRREAAISELVEIFESKERERDPMVFGLEKGFHPNEVKELENCFNRATGGPLMGAHKPLEIESCLARPAELMEALRSGKQKLKSSQDPAEVAGQMLGTTPELRFLAEIEGDRIGGFKSSSMSPGKQALFALSLILDDSEEAWPLLIDQPEDDLDSRSIATQLVDYLVKRKSERQIIMVTHDANLVIGADAEQVIVSNRHGVNTKNVRGQTFDYFSGSLEHTRERRDAKIELEKSGIREHACDILDGGEEAFRKRKRKYKIS